jgi:[FeFe] hydrogenase H-cluster maturation GTPase HydF
MSLNSTQSAERIHIGFFGCRNVGKSSIVNKITNQEMSIVSKIKGTTTDPVKKSMEILPLGPVLIIDTPGIDDEGTLGEERIKRTKKVLKTCDIAVLITEANRPFNSFENELIDTFNENKTNYIVVKNKCDLVPNHGKEDGVIFASAKYNTGIEEIKEAIAKFTKQEERFFVKDLVKIGDLVVLVVPIDSSAPKGRIILPQQQALRDILDAGGTAIVTKETALESTLNMVERKPDLVITDSQVFKVVSEIVPDDIPLTSFSILMSRYKGFLDEAIKGAEEIDKIEDGDSILISEGCTHHRQCEDIGTVKIPNLLKKHTGKTIHFEWTNGGNFPDDLSKYKLVIHCGGCMLNELEMKRRMEIAIDNKVPFTNYGIAISYMNGILDRTIKPLKR